MTRQAVMRTLQPGHEGRVNSRNLKGFLDAFKAGVARATLVSEYGSPTAGAQRTAVRTQGKRKQNASKKTRGRLRHTRH